MTITDHHKPSQTNHDQRMTITDHHKPSQTNHDHHRPSQTNHDQRMTSACTPSSHVAEFILCKPSLSFAVCQPFPQAFRAGHAPQGACESTHPKHGCRSCSATFQQTFLASPLNSQYKKPHDSNAQNLVVIRVTEICWPIG
uniref:Uncharacterized protein n=1 Tax=Dunaliella tertiolecta TaxID=3047 RepID=A0A7S3QR68_DUNTE